MEQSLIGAAIWFAAFVVGGWLLMRLRRAFARRMDIIEIAVRGGWVPDASSDDLTVREDVRARIESLALGRVAVARNAKTGTELMRVWLRVPDAAAAVPPVEAALAGCPVEIKVLAPPVHMGLFAMARRAARALWANRRETRRS